jgi:SAM-dependent methyltransferase
MEVTRGKGLLEGFLARQRWKTADKIIPNEYRKGRILDIGCGAYPFFLINTDFSVKYGLDKISRVHEKTLFDVNNISFIHYDIEGNKIFPFENEYIDVITMLAVIEHIEPGNLIEILNEIYRVLNINGLFVMTTPASWTDPLLKIMAKVGLVSKIEIDEHKDTYTHRKLVSLLQLANFSKDRIIFGYFEMFSNLWLVAKK